jgi:uncharacterized protein
MGDIRHSDPKYSRNPGNLSRMAPYPPRSDGGGGGARQEERRWLLLIEVPQSRVRMHNEYGDAVTEVTVRVYGALNDFLPPQRRQMAWPHVVGPRQSVKDLIESLGVPHPEIDLILVNGVSVPFDYAVQSADRIAVYPRFTNVDIGTLTHVRPTPPDAVRFVVDVHLGKLARRLRLIGLDTAYRPDANDAELAALADRERRILLTRDQGLLKRRLVVHGYFVRETRPHPQLVEVLRRFGPLDLHPFSRCLRCNDVLREVAKSAIDATLLPRTRQHYDQFEACGGCGRIYWKGSHWERLMHAIDDARREAAGGGVGADAPPLPLTRTQGS